MASPVHQTAQAAASSDPGIASDATAQETRGFVDTIRTRDVIGASYYTFPMIRDDQWRALRTIG